MGRPKWWPDLTLPGRLEIKVAHHSDTPIQHNCINKLSKIYHDVFKKLYLNNNCEF